MEIKNWLLVRLPEFSSSRPSAGQANRADRPVQCQCCSAMPKAGPSRLFARAMPITPPKRATATANRERSVTFDEERLAIVKDRLGDVLLSTITRETIEGLQAKRKLDAVSNIPSGALTVAVTFRLHHACVSRLLPPEALRAGT
jgi:hypothetical protein